LIDVELVTQTQQKEKRGAITMFPKVSSQALYRTLSLALAVVAVIGLSSVGYSADEPQGSQAQEQVLARAAEVSGQPAEELEFLKAVTANYPALGEQAIAGKAYNPVTDEIMTVFLDPGGNGIDRDLDAEETAAKLAKGPIHPALEARLAGAVPDEMIPVAFWVPAIYPDPVEHGELQTTAEVEAWKAEIQATRAAALATAREGFLGELSAAGYAPEYMDDIRAAIHVTLPASEVQRLATHPDVVHVFLDEGRYYDAGVGIGDPVRSSRGYRTHKFLDLSGATMQVGVVECCGEVYWSSLYSGHPYMQGINWDNPGCTSKDHATAVTGFIRSAHTEERGQAYNAHINFSSPCDGSISGAENSLSWVSGSSGNYSWVINHSYGGDVSGVVGTFSLDATMDSNSRNSRNVNVVAAGNNCNGYGSGTCNVDSPGIAYNPITVGNFNDQQTWSWGDDGMWISSSYDDPSSTYGDREKPEVSAAGTAMTSATPSSPWIGYVGNGTSYSSPVVAAAVAILGETDSSIRSYPEEAKAIMMATAWNNIEGSARLSDQDGAGGIDAWRAAQIADSSTNGDSGHFYRYCSDSWPYTVGTFAVAAGRTVRVVIAWPTNPDFYDYANRPSSDFDLKVESPGGTYSYWSSSWDNTYEVIYISSTPLTGSYTIKVYNARCNEPTTGTWIGWAWGRAN
jgi:hypothetical protein